MEQIEFEMSCVIFCDCMAGAAFTFPHIFLTSFFLSSPSTPLSLLRSLSLSLSVFISPTKADPHTPF